MPKIQHICDICQEEVNEHSGCKVYICEIYKIWIHAKCMFPNASKANLKVLYEFHSCFDVKCSDCKTNLKEKQANLVMKENLTRLIETIDSKRQDEVKLIDTITENFKNSLLMLLNKNTYKIKVF